ncbi:2-oxoacid:acceptor oxidoreductase family protein [Endomicrobium proavitum]|uniref:Putative flavodoxin/ferredoxin oxidoreductase gamma subunit n=1 Tax=Endomicrobium proavitum TaxID=1408281 RepID=A0A0G3WJP0_9BACT|nr:2-oxoacid:acceptor oxidoreductase family protein [Endomicrobium proavitum]AKL97714.1 Putative flavodoxin/ferredoxin oxidoreductase gamma subunit [Endomicrobium proavitum]
MKNEIIVAGFGGQGVLLAGTLVAQAALEQKLHTTWFPSYGAEMRGGTANSTVVVSSEEIGSPLAFNPNALIALNEPSLDKFMPRMTDDAVIIANSSIISENKKYRVRPYFVPVTDIADKEIQNVKTANMVAVGALVKALELCASRECRIESEILNINSVFKAVEKAFAAKPKLIDVNKKAVQAGYNFIKDK